VCASVKSPLSGKRRLGATDAGTRSPDLLFGFIGIVSGFIHSFVSSCLRVFVSSCEPSSSKGAGADAAPIHFHRKALRG
jgi:hypothetical protein